MFGNKKAASDQPFDNEGYEAKYEYLAVAYFGIASFNTEVNILARKGWELVNGCMAGTAHYGYLRRPLKAQEPQDS